tara:strand:- start:76 stop:1227 length:1152 start_codon:yes stop_codon:yes gene_type:complete
MFQFAKKFFQEPVTILRTFVFPPLFFILGLVLVALPVGVIFDADSIGNDASMCLGAIVVFLLSFYLFGMGLDQVSYYVKIDNLGLKTEQRENEQKSDDSQDTDTYKIVSVRSGSFAEDRLAKLVNEHIREGWRVVGGQSTSGGHRSYQMITQAMERDLPKDESEPDEDSDWRENRAKELGIFKSESSTDIITMFEEIYDVMLELPEDDLGHPGGKFHGEKFSKNGISWHPDSKTDNPVWLDRNIPEYESTSSILWEWPLYCLTHAMNCYWGNGHYFFLYAYFDPFSVNWELEDNNAEFSTRSHDLKKWRKTLDPDIENRINGIITNSLPTLKNYYEEYIQMKREKYGTGDWKDKPQWVLKNPKNYGSQTNLKRFFALFDYYSG